MACNSKMAGLRAKHSEICDSGIAVICTEGTFDLSVFNVILSSFGAVVSIWPLARKLCHMASGYSTISTLTRRMGLLLQFASLIFTIFVVALTLVSKFILGTFGVVFPK